MIKLYALLFVIAILGGIGYGAKYYYDTTQATIATLRENNSKLEVAVDTANQSLEVMQQDMVKLSTLNKNLQSSLQKAEAYGDELKGKLSRMDLTLEALKDAKKLEGKMNGATANLWRDLMADTGNTSEFPLPDWLQQVPTGTGDQNSNQDGEGTDTGSGETQAAPTN